jgi:hypothetical protein
MTAGLWRVTSAVVLGLGLAASAGPGSTGLSKPR